MRARVRAASPYSGPNATASSAAMRLEKAGDAPPGGRHGEIAPSGIARIAHEHAGGAGLANDAYVDRVVVRSGDCQRGPLKVARIVRSPREFTVRSFQPRRKAGVDRRGYDEYR